LRSAQIKILNFCL